MSGSGLDLSGSRIQNATQTNQAAEDTNVTGWTLADDFIYAAAFSNLAMGGTEETAIELRWRNKTDAGSFAALAATGALNWTGVTDLLDDDPVTTGVCTGTGTFSDGFQHEGSNNGTVAISGGDWSENHYAVDGSGATAGKEYEFEMYDTDAGAAIGTCLATITMAGGVTTHVATGALLAQDAVTAGTAAVVKKHDATGALLAQDATIAGTALRDQTHDATGALLGQDAVISGSAARSTGSVTHVATGALLAQDAVIAGTALRDKLHDATGSLLAQDAIIAGTALRDQTHDATGALLAQDAVTAGTAAVIKTHVATGALEAQSAVIAGSAVRGVPTGAVTIGIQGSNLGASLYNGTIA